MQVAAASEPPELSPAITTLAGSIPGIESGHSKGKVLDTRWPLEPPVPCPGIFTVTGTRVYEKFPANLHECELFPTLVDFRRDTRE